MCGRSSEKEADVRGLETGTAEGAIQLGAGFFRSRDLVLGPGTGRGPRPQMTVELRRAPDEWGELSGARSTAAGFILFVQRHMTDVHGSPDCSTVFNYIGCTGT